MKKKIISLVLCAVMVFSLGATAFAAEPEYETITGEYTYCPSLVLIDMLPELNMLTNQTYTFTYSDSYFTHSGYQYDHGLATMSMALTQASFANADSSTEGWDKANANFNALMKQCGFSKLGANEDAVSHPGGDTLGAYAASKKIVDNGKEYTLIALGIRGHNYGGEWFSNFDMGASGDHAGFADARDKAVAFLKEYIADNKITGDVKIWTTGYSRGAITANMLGGYLDQGNSLGENVSFSPRDLYCYTFETPQGVLDEHAHDAIYCNIHNIMNINDFVPMVSFSEWGHTRYGVDYYVPSYQNDANYDSLKAQMKTELDKMGCMDVLGLIEMDMIEDFNYVSLNPFDRSKSNYTQIEFYDEAISALLSTLAPSREYYVKNLQSDIMELSKTLLGVDTARLIQAISLFGQKFMSLSNFAEMLNSLTITGMIAHGTAIDVVIDLFMECMQEANCANYDGAQVRAMLSNLAPKLMTFVAKYPSTAVTLLANILVILNAHFSEVTHAWLRAMPAEYFEAQGVQNNDFCPNCDTMVLSATKDAKKATCMEAGYTGDVFCTVCGEMIDKGFVVPRDKNNHSSDPFNDIASSGYHDYIYEAAELGLINGYTDGSYKPAANVTRGQFITIMWRAVGSPYAKSIDLKFADVGDIYSGYLDAVAWGVENGIIAGYENNTFRPNQNISRAQMATFMYRYLKNVANYDFGNVSAVSFADAGKIANAYKDAVNAIVSAGVMSGFSATTFSPNTTASRGQAATVLLRMYKLLNA